MMVSKIRNRIMVGLFSTGVLIATSVSALAQSSAPVAAPSSSSGPTRGEAVEPPLPVNAPVDATETVYGKTVMQFLTALRAKDVGVIQNTLSAKFAMPRRWKSCAIDENDRACFIRFLRETYLAAEGQFELQKMRVEWHIVRINIAFSSRSTREEGASRILLTDEFLVEDGKIQSFIRTPRTEDPETRAYYLNRHTER